METIFSFLKQKSPSTAKVKKASALDDHGQPVNRRLNYRKIEDRQIDELIGMCKMAIGDGHVDMAEVKALLSWLENNQEASDRWPANVLHDRIANILEDGIVDQEEEGELIDLLMQVTGQPIDKTLAQMSSTLPLCRPFPEIAFADRNFCLTGKFFYGPRKHCEKAIEELGGHSASSPSGKTDYLVIGMIGSTDWIHSTHGRKIEAAVELRETGKKIRIVSEEHWTKYLNDN